MAAIVKAFNFEKFSDKAQIKTSLMMEISGSANGSTGWERISRKFVDYTASKPVEVGDRWKNTYAYIGVTFSYILQTKATKAGAFGTGGFSVDGLKFNIVNVTKPSGFVEARTKPLVELSQEGLLIFSNENEFLRVNDEGMKLRGGQVTIDNLSVAQDAKVTGSLEILGPTIFSGSLRVQSDIPIGFGTDQPESKLHVKDTFESSADFQIGANPSWFYDKTGYTVRSTMTPIQDANGEFFIQAAFGADMLFDTYKHRSAVLYGENYSGQDKVKKIVKELVSD